MTNEFTFPGFIDVHVHFRDPGVPSAETTASGLAAAERGGFAAVVTMPNTEPACDSAELVNYQREQAKLAKSPVVLFPSVCITRGRGGVEPADFDALAAAGAAFFTDDGSYVGDDRAMERAMERCAELGICVCQHAMDPSLLKGGVIRDCALARKLNLPVMGVEVETAAIRRDLAICRATGCRLHIQHISTAEGVGLVRAAQREGLPVTAEATPHHLLLSCDDLTADDANFKMAPPLGNHEDRAELRKAVLEGVLMFATDHAPHPADKKSLGFLKSANGIVGLETAIPITYQALVAEEGMPIETWAQAWYDKPRWILSGACADELKALRPTTVRLGEARKIDVSSFASLSRNCPYDGMTFDCWPVGHTEEELTRNEEEWS
jgi:dihydroorotase